MFEHRDFRASERNKRFLEFVVCETLSGRGERIKAYTIAVDVFGREPDFDPSADPIVRIEATRLRNALETFYAGPGANADLRVLLPKGRYIPTFVETSDNFRDPMLETKRGDVTLPTQLHALVEILSAPEGPLMEAARLASELLIESLRQHDIKVVYAPPDHRTAAKRAFDQFLQHPQNAYAIDIPASAQGVSWRVSNLETSEILCFLRLDLDADRQLPLAGVQQITRRLVQIVSNDSAGDTRGPARRDH